MLSEQQAWQALAGVPDPEIPVISVCELGIVRKVQVEGDDVTVVLTPTYTGCPALEVIESAVRTALLDAGARTVTIQTQLAPAWTTEWLAPEAAEKLRAFGIAPPVRNAPDRITCPRCRSSRTERLAQFGSTACKALYRCQECHEPFDYFKPI